MTEVGEPKRLKETGWKFAYETLRDEILSLALAPGRRLDETTSPTGSACRARRSARR